MKTVKNIAAQGEMLVRRVAEFKGDAVDMKPEGGVFLISRYTEFAVKGASGRLGPESGVRAHANTAFLIFRISTQRFLFMSCFIIA